MNQKKNFLLDSYARTLREGNVHYMPEKPVPFRRKAEQCRPPGQARRKRSRDRRREVMHRHERQNNR